MFLLFFFAVFFFLRAHNHMVGRQPRVRGQWCPRLRRLDPSPRGGVVGVHLEVYGSDAHEFLWDLRLHRFLQPVDVGDDGRDMEGDGLGALRGVEG